MAAQKAAIAARTRLRSSGISRSRADSSSDHAFKRRFPQGVRAPLQVIVLPRGTAEKSAEAGEGAAEQRLLLVWGLRLAAAAGLTRSIRISTMGPLSSDSAVVAAERGGP